MNIYVYISTAAATAMSASLSSMSTMLKLQFLYFTGTHRLVMKVELGDAAMQDRPLVALYLPLLSHGGATPPKRQCLRVDDAVTDAQNGSSLKLAIYTIQPETLDAPHASENPKFGTHTLAPILLIKS